MASDHGTSRVGCKALCSMTVQEQLGQCALRTGAPASRMLFVLTSQARSGSTAFCNSTCPMGASLLPPASARTPLQHLLPVLVARSAKPTPEHHVRGRDLQSAQCESGSPTTAARIHARGTTCRHWGYLGRWLARCTTRVCGFKIFPYHLPFAQLPQLFPDGCGVRKLVLERRGISLHSTRLGGVR